MTKQILVRNGVTGSEFYVNKEFREDVEPPIKIVNNGFERQPLDQEVFEAMILNHSDCKCKNHKQ